MNLKSNGLAFDSYPVCRRLRRRNNESIPRTQGQSSGSPPAEPKPEPEPAEALCRLTNWQVHSQATNSVKLVIVGSEGSINSNQVLLHGLIFMHFLACDEQFLSFSLNSSSNFSILPKNFYFRSPCQLLGL